MSVEKRAGLHVEGLQVSEELVFGFVLEFNFSGSRIIPTAIFYDKGRHPARRGVGGVRGVVEPSVPYIGISLGSIRCFLNSTKSEQRKFKIKSLNSTKGFRCSTSTSRIIILTVFGRCGD